MKKDSIESSCFERVNNTLSKIKLDRNAHDAMCMSFMWGNILLVWVVVLVVVMRYKILDNEKTRWFRIIVGGLSVLLYTGGWIMGYFYFYLKPNFGNCAIAADPMNKKMFSIGKFPISQWPFSHFILYMSLAFVLPRGWWLIILVGITWEGVELLMKHLQKKPQKVARTRINASEYTYLTYWESTFEDIILNISGVALGVGLAKLVDIYRPFGINYREGFISSMRR